MLQITESRISDKQAETPEVKDNQCKTTREEIIKSIYLKKRDKKITSSSACDCFQSLMLLHVSQTFMLAGYEGHIQTRS